MPKIVDYPLFPFDKVLGLANAVDYLGGSCTIADCAQQLKKKLSGGFGVLVSSAIKHDLVLRKGERLSVSDLYKKIKFSYDPAEKIDCQRISFLQPVLYRKIYERFKGKELPFSMLDKLLIREFQVDEKVSQKITGFFVDGLQRMQLLKAGKLLDTAHMPAAPPKNDQLSIPMLLPGEELNHSDKVNLADDASNLLDNNLLQTNHPEKFVISIKGEGVSSTLVIETKEDFLIVEAILSKIKRKLSVLQ